MKKFHKKLLNDLEIGLSHCSLKDGIIIKAGIKGLLFSLEAERKENEKLKEKILLQEYTQEEFVRGISTDKKKLIDEIIGLKKAIRKIQINYNKLMVEQIK